MLSTRKLFRNLVAVLATIIISFAGAVPTAQADMSMIPAGWPKTLAVAKAFGYRSQARPKNGIQCYNRGSTCYVFLVDGRKIVTYMRDGAAFEYEFKQGWQ
jgi:hypothetical protein